MQITHEGLGEQESAGGHCGGGGSRVKCIQGMHSVAVLAAIEWTGYPSIPPGTDALPSSCDTVRRSCSQPFGTVIPPGVLQRTSSIEKPSHHVASLPMLDAQKSNAVLLKRSQWGLKRCGGIRAK